MSAASEWMVKTTLRKMGTFSTPTYGGVGEPFKDGRQPDERNKGAQFVTNKQRMGQSGDNWNSGRYGRRVPVQRLYEGEKYVDPHKHQTSFEMRERKLNLTENGFKYSSPNKHSSGLGGYWGCIGPKFGHEPDFVVLKKEDKPGVMVHELRQVITNPPRKGYGTATPGNTFGAGPLKGDTSSTGRYGGKEYGHAPDPYDLPRQREIAERKANSEALQGRPAFKQMSHSLDFFDTHKEHARVATSKIFTEDPIIPKREAKVSTFANVSDKAFYPSRAPRSGPLGTFEKFPVYKEDPLEEKMKVAKAAAAEARIAGAAPFKPTSKPFTTPCPTIMFHIPGAKPTS